MSTPLMQPAELIGRLDEPGLVLADVRWNLAGPPGRPEFEAGHVPGAVWVDLETELAGPPGAGGRHPLPSPTVLQAALRRIGVREGDLLVAYDGATSLAASRLWWLCTDAGVDARVLDGGLAAWRAAGGPIERGPGRTPAGGDIVVGPGQRDRLDATGVAAALEAGRTVVDVRAPERYAGVVEPMDPVAGHIPGAANLPSPGNQHPDGRFLDATAIRARFADTEDPVLYCGSGITAAHSLLALEAAGRTGTIYPGSWSDWITDPDRPVAVGPQP